MLKAIAFALIFIGVSMQLPSKVESYKKYKSIDNLLEIGSFLLALGYIFG